VTNYNNPTQYTAVSNGVFGPGYIAKNGPVQHIVKREAEAEPEAEADADALSVYNTLPLTYNTAVNTYSHAVATPFVKTVAPALAYKAAVPAVTYSQAVATPAVTYKAVATPALTYKAAVTPAVTYNTAVNPVVYAQPQVASHTVTNYNNPTQYTAVSNGVFGPGYIAKNGPVQHIVKREAEAEPEAEADADALSVYNTLPLTYNTAVNTYSHAVATPFVKTVAPALAYKAAVPAVTYSHAVATPAVTYKAVATPAVTYKAAVTPAVTYNTAVNPVVYAQPQVASHTVTSYKNPTHYTAVSNGVYGPQYIAKNGAVQHIVKREAEAEAEANHHYLYNGVYNPTVYNHALVTPSVYNTAVHHAVAAPSIYKAAPHAVALTPFGATHSSNVGVCTNNLGAVVPC